MTKTQRKALAAALAAIGLTASACSSDSGNAASGSRDDSAIPAPNVKCDVPAQNLDGNPIDTAKAQGEITFMTQNLKKDFSPFFEKVIANFEKENPGTKVNWIDKPGGPDFDRIMSADAVECRMADVINAPESSIMALSQANLLLDLDVKAPGIGDRFLDSIWKSADFGHNKAHTGLPWYTFPMVTTYNKDVLTRNGLDPNTPPTTMAEIFEMGHKIAANKSGDYALYGNANWYLAAQWLAMGVKMTNDDNTEFVFADDPIAREWVTQMAQLYQDGAIPKDSLTGEPDPNKAYFSGNLALGTPNPSFLRAVKKNNPKVYEVTGVTQFPHNKGIKQQINTQFLAVSAATKNAPLALKFADYMTSAEQEFAWARDGGAIIFPPNKQGLEMLKKNPPTITDDEPFKEAYNASFSGMDNAMSYPAAQLVNGAVQKALVDNVNRGIRGETSPEQTLKNAQDEMNKHLKRALAN